MKTRLSTFFGTFCLLLLLTSSTSIAQEEQAAGPVYREMIYGDPTAPVTIVEYASLKHHGAGRMAPLRTATLGLRGVRIFRWWDVRDLCP